MKRRVHQVPQAASQALVEAAAVASFSEAAAAERFLGVRAPSIIGVDEHFPVHTAHWQELQQPGWLQRTKPNGWVSLRKTSVGTTELHVIPEGEQSYTLGHHTTGYSTQEGLELIDRLAGPDVSVGLLLLPALGIEALRVHYDDGSLGVVITRQGLVTTVPLLQPVDATSFEQELATWIGNYEVQDVRPDQPQPRRESP
jgi:hypothetical protein